MLYKVLSADGSENTESFVCQHCPKKEKTLSTASTKFFVDAVDAFLIKKYSILGTQQRLMRYA